MNDMKRFVYILMITILGMGLLTGCSIDIATDDLVAPTTTAKVQADTEIQTSDGMFECEGHTYKYRLEISGAMPNSDAETTLVYLSNIEPITFEQAWKASGLSSNTDDYFDVEDAVFVEQIMG